MKISPKTLEALRNIINGTEEYGYRSGPKLVAFFNELGFNDTYGQGFPSRHVYTDDRLSVLNGTGKMDDAIKAVLAPINFIGQEGRLGELIKDFNKYLAFDGYKLQRTQREILINKVAGGSNDIIDDSTVDTETLEDKFMKQEFKNISLDSAGIDQQVTEILKQRLVEVEQCLKSKSYLSVIFMCGSMLEGLLLGVATKAPGLFNQSAQSPKDSNGKPRPFNDWTLNSFIDVAYGVGILQEDVKKHSHSLRDFRNYIHPYQQMANNFIPHEYTARIAWQVLQAAIHETQQAHKANIF